MGLESIDVVEVNKDNFSRMWPLMLVSIRKATLIGLDLELSGLGSRQAMTGKSLEERYGALREAASTRAILSLGIALFEQRPAKGKRLRFRCQVFNVLCLCSQPFTIEPGALQFLARHSFDFNRLIHKGVSYNRADQCNKECHLRSLFHELLGASSPIAFHNGLVDLAFLYANFHCSLPSSLPVFLSDLSDLFPSSSPIVDSKYLAEFHGRLPSSYLEYVFRKAQRDNAVEEECSRVHLHLSFHYSLPLVPSELESIPASLPPSFPHHSIPADLASRLCQQFANHGFCRQRESCSLEHNVDMALDWENMKKEKERQRRKRRRESYSRPKGVGSEEEKGEDTASEEATEESVKEAVATDSAGPPLSVAGSHRAGADAFMTGVAVLFQQRMALARGQPVWEGAANQLPLSGKALPLTIQKSAFVDSSPRHLDLLLLIQAARNTVEASRASPALP